MVFVDLAHNLKNKIQSKQMTKRQIINYYGQKYDNVKHIKGYINALCERYKNELKTNKNEKNKLFRTTYIN